MERAVLLALLLPLLGTTMGAAGVFFLQGGLNGQLQRGLSGFSAGVMTAASVWSLILPALERSSHLGKLCFLPAVAGVWAGFCFLLVLDRIAAGLRKDNAPRSMLVLAVALHNLPEGMAVGAVAAALLAGTPGVTPGSLLTFALGIALQNLPEGAIISMPLKSRGMKTGKAFGCGFLSGVIEPLGTVATVALSGLLVPVLPFLLSFSAGAMLIVVVRELIPEANGEKDPLGCLLFAAGFTLMMAMDVALG